MTRRLYAAPRYVAWEALRFPGDHHRLGAPPGQPGVLLVYDSVEALRTAYPDVEDEEIVVLVVGERA